MRRFLICMALVLVAAGCGRDVDDGPSTPATTEPVPEMPECSSDDTDTRSTCWFNDIVDGVPVTCIVYRQHDAGGLDCQYREPTTTEPR